MRMAVRTRPRSSVGRGDKAGGADELTRIRAVMDEYEFEDDDDEEDDNEDDVEEEEVEERGLSCNVSMMTKRACKTSAAYTLLWKGCSVSEDPDSTCCKNRARI